VGPSTRIVVVVVRRTPPIPERPRPVGAPHVAAYVAAFIVVVVFIVARALRRSRSRVVE
jgi:hypothetical protein